MTNGRIADRLGLPWWAILALVGLAVPRVVVHDLGATPGPLAQAALALIPPATWVIVAVWRRLPSPVLTLVTVGSLYGVALALVHNLMWDTVFQDADPTLGGELAGDLAPGIEELVLRTAMSASSVFTGMILGLIAGLVASAIIGARERARS